MARPKIHEWDLTRNDPRWRRFGKWLRSNRLNNHVKLKDAAESIGVTPRQFARYESGVCSVPRERIVDLARAVKMSQARTLMRAGYEESCRDIDPENELRWIWTYLLQGNLSDALQILLELHFDLEEGSGKPKKSHQSGGDICDAFTNALVAVERLPGWLCEELMPFVERRQKRAKKQDLDFPLTPEHRDKIRGLIQKAISKPITFSERARKKPALGKV